MSQKYLIKLHPRVFLLILLLLAALLPVRAQPQFSVSGDVEEMGNFLEIGWMNTGSIGMSGGFVFPDHAPAPWNIAEYIDVRSFGSQVNVSGSICSDPVSLYGATNIFVVASGSSMNGYIALNGINDVADVGGTILGVSNVVADPGCYLTGGRSRIRTVLTPANETFNETFNNFFNNRVVTG